MNIGKVFYILFIPILWILENEPVVAKSVTCRKCVLYGLNGQKHWICIFTKKIDQVHLACRISPEMTRNCEKYKKYQKIPIITRR